MQRPVWSTRLGKNTDAVVPGLHVSPALFTSPRPGYLRRGFIKPILEHILAVHIAYELQAA